MYVGREGDRTTQIHIIGSEGAPPPWAKSAREDPTRFHVALAVADIQETCAELDRMRTPYFVIDGLVGPQSRQVFVDDPAGNLIEFHQIGLCSCDRSVVENAARKTLPVLETERLVLRTWSPADLDDYAAMFAEPEVAEFLSVDGKPMSRADAWRGLASLIGHWHMRGYGMFAVIDRASGEFVGRIGPLEPEGWPDFEIGWGLRRKYWGRGYASEAVKACIAYAFTQLKKTHFISIIDPLNVNSIRVAERVGERLEGETTLAVWPGRRLLKYGLHRSDWDAG
jgi:RimJ/RimL family protein N-acetyltransferase